MWWLTRVHHCNQSSFKSYTPLTFQWNLDVLEDTLLCSLLKYQHFTHSTRIITTLKEKPWRDGSQECTPCNKSSIKPYAPPTFQWNLDVLGDTLLCSRVANITDFSVEVQNLENDSYFYTEFQNFQIFFTDFAIFWFFLTFFIVIVKHHRLRPWSSWTANSDKKYTELNGVELNVNKPCVTSQKTAFLKDK